MTIKKRLKAKRNDIEHDQDDTTEWHEHGGGRAQSPRDNTPHSKRKETETRSLLNKRAAYWT
jgi:hypothetical protein